jgi:hypothetical protein
MGSGWAKHREGGLAGRKIGVRVGNVHGITIQGKLQRKGKDRGC